MISMTIFLMILFTVCASALGAEGATNANTNATKQETVGVTASAAQNQLISAARARLLDLGRDAADAIPTDPHERDRARVQEVVARAAVALGDVARGEDFATNITTWRRGVVYSDLAVSAAKAGDRVSAERFIARAESLGPRVLDWQRDRIRVGVAQAEALLGEADRVRDLEALVGDAERGKITATRAATATPEQFAAILEDIRKSVASGSLDATINALEACVQLATMLDGDEVRWSEIESVFTAANGKIARELYIHALLRLADVRLDDGAKTAAVALIERARAVRDEVRWAPESELPITAALARRIARAQGDDAGVSALETGIAAFKANEEAVANVFRAQALRPAAEAFVAFGARDRAVEIYRWAIEAGALNPNARPRAEDLAQTCASLAISGTEPDEAMWTRLAAIRAGLSTPW